MGMSMGFSHRMEARQAHRMEMRHAMTSEQRFEMAMRAQMMMIEALRGEQYSLDQNSCPKCGHKLTAQEVLAGFRNDAADLTTKCPICETRFCPDLVAKLGHGSSVYVSFYCAMQTTARLHGLEMLPPDQIAHLHSSVYRSAIVHFGTMKAAFARVGIEYSYVELPEWQVKVLPYLGKVPDTLVAKVSGVKVQEVRKLRRETGISAYTWEKFRAFMEE
ncbi:MAG: hypothetical protein WCJ29_06335 [bacterium]